MAPHTFNLDARSGSRMTLLCEACYHGHEPAVCMLLNAGASLHQCSPFQFEKECLPRHFLAPPLFYAMESDNLGLIITLLQRGAQPGFLLNGSMPLLYYVVTRKVEEEKIISILALLLRYGADVNASLTTRMDYDVCEPMVPLLCALHVGKFQVANFLLDKGADRTVLTSSGRTALQLVFEWMCHEKDSVDAQMTLFKRLYTKQQDVAAFKYGEVQDTALHNAAKTSNVELVQCLMRAGVSPQSVNTRGQSALDVACTRLSKRNGTFTYDLSVIHILIEAGSTVKPDAHLMAAWKGCWDVVECLLPFVDVHASVETMFHAPPCSCFRDRHCKGLVAIGDTALTFAILSNNLRMVKILLQKGANVHGRSRDGTTPLHVACAGRRCALNGYTTSCADVNIVAALLRAGADVNAERASDLHATRMVTPLSSIVLIQQSTAVGVCEKLLRELVQLLIKSGANQLDERYDCTAVWLSAISIRSLGVASILVNHSLGVAHAEAYFDLAVKHYFAEGARMILAQGGFSHCAYPAFNRSGTHVNLKRSAAAQTRHSAVPSFVPRMKWEL